MAHPEQREWFQKVKNKYPEKFQYVSILDVGSLDINGNNRWLFEDCAYIGLDVGEGKNVDIVCKGHEYDPSTQYDVVISSECFEHDMHWKETIRNCVRLTKPGGLFTFTCATTGRNEHGTTRTSPQDSPHTHVLFNDYYMNLTEEDINTSIDIPELFSEYEFGVNKKTKDLYFYGIKKLSNDKD